MEAHYDLHALRQAVAAIEPSSGHDPKTLFTLGAEGVDRAVGGGLARGALHEVFAVTRRMPLPPPALRSDFVCAPPGVEKALLHRAAIRPRGRRCSSRWPPQDLSTGRKRLEAILAGFVAHGIFLPPARCVFVSRMDIDGGRRAAANLLETGGACSAELLLERLSTPETAPRVVRVSFRLQLRVSLAQPFRLRQAPDGTTRWRV